MLLMNPLWTRQGQIVRGVQSGSMNRSRYSDSETVTAVEEYHTLRNGDERPGLV